ncbi:MAG: 50S ribosomal protein L17, partial [Firmicutes bacterium]|nr:50S ribosomal protein L17 [Bacillota bacterium]
MSGYRKLGRTASQRKALLRNQVTNLLYHGKIETTEAKAKEIRSIAEKLITLAVKEKDNFDEVTVTAKVAKKDDSGKRVKEVVNGKKVTVFDEVEKTIKKDQPSRLNARRKMLAYLYPVTEVPADGRKVRSNTVKVDMAKKLFEEIAPKYAGRNGGYTRMIKVGARRGDGAET